MAFDDVKERLRDSCDIVDVINSYVPLKKAGANYKACCPFHQEKTPSFNVNSQKQMYYCFGCQKGGDVYNFVMEHEGVDFIGAMRILARFSGIQFDEDELRSGGHQPVGANGRPAPRAPKDQLYDLHEKLSAWYQRNLRSEVGREAMEYVKGRGLNDDLLVKFGIGFAPESWDAALEWGLQAGFSLDLMKMGGILTVKDEDDPRARPYDRFRNRLMFPIWNPQGRIVGFSGRVLSQEHKGAKYVNTPETPVFHKGSILYALPLARKGIKDHGFALMCEGQLDVIACHAAGLDNAIAPQGTAFTDHQARILKRYTETLVLAFDSDSAGINAALKSVESFLPAGLRAKVVLMEDGQDPDSLVRSAGSEALLAKVQQAQDYFDFLLDHLCKEHDPRSPQGSGIISAQFLETIIRLPNRVARAEYCQRLAARLRVPETYVFQEMNALVNRQRRQSRYRQQDGRDTGRGQTPPPFDSGPDQVPAPHTAPTSICELAEAVLLDIALHHEAYAQRLDQELPHEYISNSDVGRALNDVLAHTSQGEWNLAETLMRQELNDVCDPAISKALITPDFGKEADKRALQKAYDDCRIKIMTYHLNQQIQDLQHKLTQVPHKDERQVILREIMELMSQRKALKQADQDQS